MNEAMSGNPTFDVDDFNNVAALLADGVRIAPSSRYGQLVPFVQQVSRQGYLPQICGEHLVQMEEYKPGYIRCPMCYPNKGEEE